VGMGFGCEDGLRFWGGLRLGDGLQFENGLHCGDKVAITQQLRGVVEGSGSAGHAHSAVDMASHVLPRARAKGHRKTW
jgi:hypothetical protein